MSGGPHPRGRRAASGGGAGDPRGDDVPALADLRRQRIGLLLKTCLAVASAHQRGVVHRDLKPSNILVTAEGEPKLLDFGIAKLVGPTPLAEAAGVTRTHYLPMTPEYASPEQFRGGAVTTASDVYQLGLLLYEILTGTRAHCLSGLTPAEAQEVVCTRPPTPPSTAVRTGSLRAGPVVAGSDPPPAFRPQDLARKLAANDPQIADSAFLRAVLDYATGKFDAAEEGYLEALKIWEKTGGPQSPDVARALSDLSLVYRRQRRLEESRAAAERALAILAVQPEAAKTDRGRTLNTLALVFRDQGEFTRALATFREALEAYATGPDPENPSVARVQTNMGSTLSDLGRLEEAKTAYLAALEQVEKQLGPDHALVAAQLINLSSLALQAQRYEQAQAYLDRALPLLLEAYGPDHLRVGLAHLNLADSTSHLGDFEAAAEHLQAGRRILEATYRPEHPMMASMLELEGEVLHRKGDLDHAVPLLAAGRAPEAEPVLRRALTLREAALPADHRDLAECHRRLGLCLEALGRRKEAAEEMKRSLEIANLPGRSNDRLLEEVRQEVAAFQRRQLSYAAATAAAPSEPWVPLDGGASAPAGETG